jgi:iron(III) transport system permease protein
MDGSRVEAARSLGSGPVRSFVDAALPQLGPAIVASSLLVFLTAAGSFTAPWYFTPGQPVMTLAIFRAHGRDPGLAASTTVVLALATLAVLAIFLRVQRAQTTGASKGVPPVPRRLGGGARVAAGFAAAAAIALLLLPHATLVLLSFHDPRAWRTEILPPSYTFAAMRGLRNRNRCVPCDERLTSCATSAAVAVGLGRGARQRCASGAGAVPGDGAVRHQSPP